MMFRPLPGQILKMLDRVWPPRKGQPVNVVMAADK